MPKRKKKKWQHSGNQKMNTKELIGQKIKDILVWSKMEVGGLHEAEVFIQLENGTVVDIPHSFEKVNIEKKIDKKVNSLFADLSDYPEYHINQEGKTISEVLESKKQRESTWSGRIKKKLGYGEAIPKEYKPYKTEYKENNIKYLKDQLITDFLMFEDSEGEGFLELENGYIITARHFAPHGIGTGLKYYHSVKDFESICGTDYQRLTDKLKNTTNNKL